MTMPSPPTAGDAAPAFPSGGGTTGALIRAFDWSRTRLGPIAGWPPSLRTAVDLVLESPAAMALLWGPEGVMIYNDGYAAVTRGRHPAPLGSPVLEAWPEIADFNRSVLEAGLRGEAPSFPDAHLVLHRPGRPDDAWFNLNYSPVRDEAGRPAGVLAVVVETTERVLAERRLREGEESLRFALRAGRLGGWTLDLATSELTLSAICKANFGRAPDAEFAYPDLLAAVHLDDRGRVRAAVARSVEEGIDYDIEYRVLWPDGTEHWLSVQARPRPGPDGRTRSLAGVSRDVTARRRADATLRRLNETLEERVAERTEDRDRLWRLSEDLLLVARFDGTIADVNPAWETVLGWSQAELRGRPFMGLIHPDDRDAFEAELSRMAAGGVMQAFEVRDRHKDGSYRRVSWTAVGDGPLLHGVGRDVTAEREAREALAAAEERLRQAQKMEALGRLTGGIAHDFNNLLQGIVGSLDVVRTRITQGRAPEIERFVDGAMTSANRAAALTQRLLAFARRQPLDPRPVAVNPLVASMEDLLRRTLGEEVAIELVLAGGLWPTLCDRNQLESAILNLAINARDAMPAGGRLTIETANVHLDEAHALRTRDVPAGRYVCVSVTDTGAGMTADVVERAFDPFFTTKAVGQGSGLGLSMIYGFARQSEGHARIDSEVGRGTTVKLYLPRHDAAQAASEERPDPKATAGDEAGGTVLVVEDEAVVRGLIVEVLEGRGYRVLEATDGPSALKVLDSTTRIDLLVSDIGLPGLNGRRLADAARARRPGLRVLFITGYAGAAVGAGFLEPGMAMLTKPFALNALAARVRDMIERG